MTVFNIQQWYTQYLTRWVAVYLETHCNIGSKRAFTTGVLDRRQLFTYLLTHKLFSSCIRWYPVSRACDWAMPALSAVFLTFSFQFSLLFFNILLTRSHQSHIGLHQHCSVLLDTRRCQKFGLVPFWCTAYITRERFWSDSNGKNGN